jgi:N-acetylglucosaminyldiphosphoundecaprenol N-acetyl-beta-D-mannosaminyltransferase
MKNEYILGVKVNVGITKSEVISEIVAMLDDRKCHYISTTNAEFIMDAQKDKSFKEVINMADLSIPDGIGTLFASYYVNSIKNLPHNVFYPVRSFYKGIMFGVTSLLKRYPIGERISGADLMYDICNYAETNNKNIYLLGGWPKDWLGRKESTNVDLAKKTAEMLRKKYPNLCIIGATSQFSPKEVDDNKTVDFIKQDMVKNNIDHLDILFVAYGHPSQEKWIKRNICKVPAYLALGVGGTFDYISGTQKRAPEIFIKSNLEWLYKLFTQPWRMRRILKAFPIFPFQVFLSTIKHS